MGPKHPLPNSSSGSSGNEQHAVLEREEKLSLEQKLAVVGRPGFLKLLQELRGFEFTSPDLEFVSNILFEDCFSLRNRSIALHLIAHVFWPGPVLLSQYERPLEAREFTFLVIIYTYTLQDCLNLFNPC